MQEDKFIQAMELLRQQNAREELVIDVLMVAWVVVGLGLLWYFGRALYRQWKGDL